MIAPLAAVLALALAAVQASPVQVRGDSPCPSAAQVAAVLPELLPGDAAYADVAWIETVGPALRIELRSLAGEVLFSRRLTSHGTCADLASIAAVVIASWTAARNPGLSLLQPGVPGPAGTETAPLAAPPPRPPAAPPTSPRPSARALDLSLGVGGATSAAGLAGVARATVGLRGRRFGLRAGIAVETERTVEVQSGTIAWRRYQVSAGPTLALLGRPATLEVGAELFAALTTAAGRSFDENRQSSALAPGLALAARLTTSTGRLRPWIEIAGQYWFADQALTVTRPGRPEVKAALPSFELRLVAGLGWVL